MIAWLTAAALAATAAPPPEGCRPAAVYVTRHAEKGDGDARDPTLSVAGSARAQALSQRLRAVALDAVYATEYRRTQATVAPTARAQQLEIRVLPAADGDALAARLRDRHCGERVLVAGHSNTVPDLIRALGGDAPTLAESDFGDLFVIEPMVDPGATGAGDGVRVRRERVGD